MKFTKMHGAGNDFIIVDADPSQDLSVLAAKLCQRRFSIGADGMMAVNRKDATSAVMRYYNADGSVGEMCGNGARCLAMYAYTHGIVDEKAFTLEPLSGTVSVEIIDEMTVRLGMGIPVDESPFENYFYDKDFDVLGQTFTGSYIQMGVPHLTIVVEEMDKELLLKYGPIIEKHPLFSAGTNVNFVQVLGRGEVLVDTWERGAGNTMACGTGASAVGHTLHHLGLTDPEIVLHAPGGDLKVIVHPDGNVDLEGPAVTVFTGELTSD